MERYLKNFENCVEKEIPFCESECPFHMEMFNFIEKASRGASKAAYKVFRNASGYPKIANYLCHEPCKHVCPRKDYGGAIELGLLEKAVINITDDHSATDYNIPMKNEKVAIIGAGISGMAALLRLSTKKYHVEVFEKTDRVGGSLWNIMDPEIFKEEFETQLAHQDYKIHFNHEITSRADLEALVKTNGFNAVYIATGKQGQDFGLVGEVGEEGDLHCRKIQGVGYFAGGELIGLEPVYSLAGGLMIGREIDNFLKTGHLYYPSNEKPTRLCKEMVIIDQIVEKTEPAGENKLYTVEELTREAKRCVECHCSYCKKNCDLIEYTDKWPIRMRDEIVATTLEGKSELKATPAKRLMSLCNQCGICKDVCPEDIDLDGLFMAGREKMHKQGKMPWVFHDFFLRDMEFADSKACAIVKGDREVENPEFAFFPGCQLGASRPETVVKTYKYLKETEKSMGLLLMCCGVPAEWSGDSEKYSNKLDEVKKAWERIGKPKLLVACPTCLKKFKENIPEIPVISVYERIAEKMNVSKINTEINSFYVFDACTSKGIESMQESVRDLAVKCGLTVDNKPSLLPRCCGFGGHGEIADPKYKGFTVSKRIAESPLPYITYCINCKDNFRQAGKEAYHILDVLTDNLDDKDEKLATVTKRRENREVLKQELLEEFWGETSDMEHTENKLLPVEVEIGEEMEEKLNKERILLKEIAETIDFCERTKRTIYDEENDIYTGYKEIGYMTYWVSYKKLDEKKYSLVNAYTHRMKIELEAVWNGRKCEVDM